MQTRLLPVRALAALLLCAAPAWLQAQSGGSPSFQPPTLSSREFNFGVVAYSGSVTALMFQWREETTARMQFTLEGGIADANSRDSETQLFAGGGLAWQLSRASTDVPLDFLLTAGAYIGGGSYSIFRVPVGVSVGHTFPLDGNISLTPYVHPRVALEACRGCSSLAVDFDLGGNLQLSRNLALRVTGVFGGSDRSGQDGFGVSLAWSPPGMKK